ncbi:C40 family peptidase [Longivirga aurantiaca]|uniref:C40 family peptidase n=1 Tax=Longivirga aurantiaca TaxID=1837743 RepID=A0ABW1T3Q3_9ACTN
MLPVLTAARRRALPATLLVSAALTIGLAGAGSASAATSTPIEPTTTAVTTTTLTPTATTTATRTATATATTTTATTLTAAQIAARVKAIKRWRAVELAKTKLGAAYVAGWSGPTKFDCSGLTRYIAKYAYGKTLPHYSKAQFYAGIRVQKRYLKPGDLVFFFKYGAHHVGLYVGNGKMISATNPRTDVKVDYVFSGWYGQRYSGAVRLV